MSFTDCILRAVEAGEIDEATAGKAQEWHERFLKKHQATGEVDADKLAANEVAEKLQAENAKKAQRKYLAFKTKKEIFEYIRDYRTAGTGKKKPHEAGRGIMDSSEVGGPPGVYQIAAEYRKRAHSMLASFLGDQKKTVLGNSPDEVQLYNVVREIFGDDTGDALAKQHAKAWSETSEWLRTEFNRAGGDVPKLEGWGLPQMHDWQYIRNLNMRSWRDMTYNLLDVEKMAKQHSMTPEEIFSSLEGVFENIKSNGTKDIDFDAMGFKKSTANSRLDHRYLIFKDADSWMTYQERMGNGDTYSIMMGHIDTMSRDIALMKKLGPNPNIGLAVLKETVKKFETELGGRNNYNKEFDNWFETFTGEASIAKNHTFAKFSANTRQTLTAAQLGSAVVSAITDPFFMGITSAFNGMPVAKTLSNIVKNLDPRNHERFLRLGLNAESWSDAAADLARYHNEQLSSPFFQKLTSGVLRASGLNYWTDIQRWTFEQELLGFITDNAKHSYKNINPALQKSLKRYEITPQEWEIIRATPQYDAGGGAMYLRTQDIAKRTDLSRQQADDLSLKLAGFITNETNFAVPTATLAARVRWGVKGQPGSVFGEINNSTFMYKSFPVHLMLTHMRRSFDELAQGRAGYLTTLLVGTTIVGGLALQMKALKDGKEPDDMNSSKFWVRALVQGGGLGIYGDFLLQDHSRYGHSFGETLAGPGAAAVGDAARIGYYALIEGAKDGKYEDGEQARNLIKSFERASNFVPGRSLWYLSAAYKRAFQDNLKAMGSKNPRRKLKRMIKDRQKKNNSGYWWDPGAATPF